MIGNHKAYFVSHEQSINNSNPQITYDSTRGMAAFHWRNFAKPHWLDILAKSCVQRAMLLKDVIEGGPKPVEHLEA
jgi:hypothetical protein